MVRVEAGKRHLLYQPTGTLYSQGFSTTQEDPVPPVTSLLESQKALLSCIQPKSPTHQEDTVGDRSNLVAGMEGSQSLQTSTKPASSLAP